MDIRRGLAGVALTFALPTWFALVMFLPRPGKVALLALTLGALAVGTFWGFATQGGGE